MRLVRASLARGGLSYASCRTGITGMAPSADNHEWTVRVESLTGTTVLSSQRWQVNVPLVSASKDGGGSATTAVRQWFPMVASTVTAPLFWIDRSTSMEAASQAHIVTQLYSVSGHSCVRRCTAPALNLTPGMCWWRGA